MILAILTVSDGCHQGTRDDLSGPALAEQSAALGWILGESFVVPDEIDDIREKVMAWSFRPDIDLILTTGGTGLGPRDLTPEAVVPLLDRRVPGLAELMRLRGIEKTDFAALSRSLAGVLNQTLILCLPGSPKGAVESLAAIARLVPHAVDLIQGRTRHAKGFRSTSRDDRSEPE